MSETKYIERYWRDANPDDAMKEPMMVARFRDKEDSNWGVPRKLSGWDRAGDLCWSNGSCFWRFCQVYDAPDPGEGWRLIDPEKEEKLLGVECLNVEHKWVPWDDNLPLLPSLIYRRRITPAVKYVPFTWEDREELRGRWIERDRGILIELQITDLRYENGLYANRIEADLLCKFWKFIDTGEPVGKKVTQ